MRWAGSKSYVGIVKPPNRRGPEGEEAEGSLYRVIKLKRMTLGLWCKDSKMSKWDTIESLNAKPT